MFSRLLTLQGSPRAVLARAAFLIAVVAVVDWIVKGNVYFGFLYLFSVLMVGTIFEPWQIALTALFCTALSELFGPFAFDPATSFPQDALLFIALAAVGLFSHEVKVRHETVEKEVIARREAEEQLEFLIQTSPIAILVMKAGGEILIGNSAADRLFGVREGELLGKNISRYIPALQRVLTSEDTRRVFRTEMQCRGKRENSDIFLANVFFSTYGTAKGPRLAALVADISEDLRDRAEYGLEQLMAGTRIIVGAVSHEVRNVCSAIAVMYENLARSANLGKNRDFEALGSLVETLNKIASLEVRKSSGRFEAEIIDLTEFLDEARIVLDPYCTESGISVKWNIPANLPSAWIDRHSLLQVLLNLTKNSRRALEGSSQKKIEVTAEAEHGMVFIRVCDTGPGISSAERLFQPLQEGAEATGLGLFLSRAFMRSFGGDLRHDPKAPGCCFVVEVPEAGGRDGRQGELE